MKHLAPCLTLFVFSKWYQHSISESSGRQNKENKILRTSELRTTDKGVLGHLHAEDSLSNMLPPGLSFLYPLSFCPYYFNYPFNNNLQLLTNGRMQRSVLRKEKKGQQQTSDELLRAQP